jgi:hypothetical protein
MKSYSISFNIQLVDATPEEACKQAWHALTCHGILPVGDVVDEDGNQKSVDLEELTPVCSCGCEQEQIGEQGVGV